MIERLGEMRKGRRERIEKGSREGIAKETKKTEGGPRPPRGWWSIFFFSVVLEEKNHN